MEIYLSFNLDDHKTNPNFCIWEDHDVKFLFRVCHFFLTNCLNDFVFYKDIFVIYFGQLHNEFRVLC